MFNRVEAYNNSFAGIQVDGSGSTGVVIVTATDTVSVCNGQNGFLVFSNSGAAPTRLMAIRPTAVNSGGTGFGASNAATTTLRLSESTANGNLEGIGVAGAANLLSYGDNDSRRQRHRWNTHGPAHQEITLHRYPAADTVGDRGTGQLRREHAVFTFGRGGEAGAAPQPQ